MIDLFNENVDGEPLSEKLNIERDKLQEAKQEILKEFKENIAELQNKMDDLVDIMDKRIAEVTRNIHTLKGRKEKPKGSTTGAEIEHERTTHDSVGLMKHTGHQVDTDQESENEEIEEENENTDQASENEQNEENNEVPAANLSRGPSGFCWTGMGKLHIIEFLRFKIVS